MAGGRAAIRVAQRVGARAAQQRYNREGTYDTTAYACDTAHCAPRHGAVRARSGHSAHRLGPLGVHLCTQSSFELNALFQSLFWDNCS